MKVKRKVKISNKDFLSIFTNRSLSFKQKTLTKFTFIEDIDGNYYLTESTSAWVKIVFVLLLPLALLVVFMYGGFSQCTEVVKDSYKGIKKPYARIDICHPNRESTNKLKEIAKWE